MSSRTDSETFPASFVDSQDWRADGYRWRQNGATKIPKKSPVLRKVHFDIQTATGTSRSFRKIAYYPLAGQTYVVVQYIGNASVAEDFPHGNSKRDVNFIGSAPSLRVKMSAPKNYKDLLLETANEPIQFQPRNSKQVTYYKTVNDRERRLGRDSFLTLHEMAYTIPDFVWSIRTYPDLVLCCGLSSLIEIVNGFSSVTMSYDTTFNVGDFYLSSLVVSFPCFREAPSIPVCFVIHERKFRSVHSEFCENLATHIKLKKGVVLVTDGEQAIVKSFKEKFPTWRLVSCWNHVLTDIEMWLKKHGGGADDIVVYKQNVRELLQCTSEGELQTKRCTLEYAWSEAFREYFRDNVMDRVLVSYTGYLRASGLAFDSITTNMSESLNMVIKQFNGWREKTPELCLLSLFRLQHFYETEVTRSFTGFGPYTPINSAEEVGIAQRLNGPTVDVDALLADIEAAMNGPSTADVPVGVRCYASDMTVVHVPQLKVFTVAASDKVTHSVRLYPEESCTCPVSTTCCHILAAKRSIGISTEKRKVLQLSTLRRNSRKAADKKSGRKTPRLGDVSFAAAPDSMAVRSSQKKCEALKNVMLADDMKKYLRDIQKGEVPSRYAAEFWSKWNTKKGSKELVLNPAYGPFCYHGNMAAEITNKFELWMDEFTGGNSKCDPDMPYSSNPGPRRILYGPYVKFVLFPEATVKAMQLIYGYSRSQAEKQYEDV